MNPWDLSCRPKLSWTGGDELKLNSIDAADSRTAPKFSYSTAAANLVAVVQKQLATNNNLGQEIELTSTGSDSLNSPSSSSISSSSTSSSSSSSRSNSTATSDDGKLATSLLNITMSEHVEHVAQEQQLQLQHLELSLEQQTNPPLDRKARKKDQNRRAAYNYRRKKMEEKNRMREEEMRLVYSRVCLIGYAEELESSIMYILSTKTRRILDKDGNAICFVCPICIQSCDNTLDLRSHLKAIHSPNNGSLPETNLG